MLKKHLLLSLLLVVAAALIALLCVAARGTPRYVSVSGEGRLSVAPDRIRLTMGVEADGPTAGAAQKAAAKRMAAVLAALERLNVPKKDVQTRTASLDPLRQYNPKDGRETLRGYRATNRIEVTSADLAKAGAILDAAVEAGANTAGGIQFYLHDGAGQRTDALAEAYQDARRRAVSLAKASGLRLGRAVSISEVSVSMPQREEMAMQANKFGLGDGDAGMPIEPGEVTVRALVRVRFRVR